MDQEPSNIHDIMHGVVETPGVLSDPQEHLGKRKRDEGGYEEQQDQMLIETSAKTTKDGHLDDSSPSHPIDDKLAQKSIPSETVAESRTNDSSDEDISPVARLTRYVRPRSGDVKDWKMRAVEMIQASIDGHFEGLQDDMKTEKLELQDIIYEWKLFIHRASNKKDLGRAGIELARLEREPKILRAIHRKRWFAHWEVCEAHLKKSHPLVMRLREKKGRPKRNELKGREKRLYQPKEGIEQTIQFAQIGASTV